MENITMSKHHWKWTMVEYPHIFFISISRRVGIEIGRNRGSYEYNRVRYQGTLLLCIERNHGWGDDCGWGEKGGYGILHTRPEKVEGGGARNYYPPPPVSTAYVMYTLRYSYQFVLWLPRTPGISTGYVLHKFLTKVHQLLFNAFSQYYYCCDVHHHFAMTDRNMIHNIVTI